MEDQTSLKALAAGDEGTPTPHLAPATEAPSTATRDNIAGEFTIFVFGK